MKIYQAEASRGIKSIEIDIPYNIGPAASGHYVVNAIQSKYPEMVIPSTTASTIAFAAKEGVKDGLQLNSVQVGLNLGFFNLSLGWKKNS